MSADWRLRSSSTQATAWSCSCASSAAGGASESSSTDTAVVFEVRDGRVVRIQGYMDRAEALEAAGLRE